MRSFSMNSAGTAVEEADKWPISNGFGQDPRWRGDGRELYYRSRGGGIVAVEIATNPAFRAGPTQPLGVLTLAPWDSAADGRRFLSLATKSGPQPYTVVLNWQARLKKEACASSTELTRERASPIPLGLAGLNLHRQFS